MTTRDELELALARNWDDVAAHAAYADLLMEEGDSRGEYIAAELAIEASALPDREKADLFDRLRERHDRDCWLGPLVAYLSKPKGPHHEGTEPMMHFWRRGWVETVTFMGEHPPPKMLAECRVFRLLRSLNLSTGRAPIGYWSWCGLLQAFARPPFFGPRELSIFNGWDDIATTGMIATGILDRLTTLEITGCRLTDYAAAKLAACPAVRRLSRLRLDDNFITPVGVAALAAVGHPDVGPQRQPSP